MPAWPSTLPITAVQGYGFSPVDPVIRTAMEAGPKRQRRQFTQTTTMVSVRWPLTDAQLATFESFHRNDILDGQSWFDFPFLNGQGKTVCPARFADTFNVVMASDAPRTWEVTSKLEIKNRPVA